MVATRSRLCISPAHALADDAKGKYCMVAFQLGNTMTENGSVSRGVCTVDAVGLLTRRGRAHSYQLRCRPQDYLYRSRRHTCISLPPETPVSMNLWGFTPRLLPNTVPANSTNFLPNTATSFPERVFHPSVDKTR